MIDAPACQTQAPTEPPWGLMRNRPLSLTEKRLVREFYNGAYHTNSRYTENNLFHQLVARMRIGIARSVFGELGKTLDGGCSAGEVVRQARSEGVDCRGFDLCPDLHDMCYPEVRQYLRMGRMDHIPYSREDGFKTLLCYDVIEHVPIDSLQALPAELSRLGISQIACIISSDTISAGHITIQDTDWYVELFARAGFRLMTELNQVLDPLEIPLVWEEDEDNVYWGTYNRSGQPRNGWNQVPGHLFFHRPLA